MTTTNAADVPLRDRFVGCLLGCAVGDALGAPLEGLWSHSIPDEPALLGGFAEFEGYPRGQFTDDTQLTVATVQSIVTVGSIDPGHIARSIASLFQRQEVIGPGGACLWAALNFLRGRDWTTCGAATGQAGNGRAMRVGPQPILRPPLGGAHGWHQGSLPSLPLDEIAQVLLYL